MRRWHVRRNQALRNVGPVNAHMSWRARRRAMRQMLRAALPRLDIGGPA